MKKAWWKSKTVQGIAIVLLSIALRFAAAKGWLEGILLETTLEYIRELSEALGLSGAAYALIGRMLTKGEKLSAK